MTAINSHVMLMTLHALDAAPKGHKCAYTVKFCGCTEATTERKNRQADQALAYIQRLYRIEKAIKHLPVDEKYKTRQTEAKPIIEKLQQWLEKHLTHSPPNMAIGKALRISTANGQAGAKVSANLYSLIEAAKANGLNPCNYLKLVFTKSPNCTTVDEVEKLLPLNRLALLSSFVACQCCGWFYAYCGVTYFAAK